MSKFPPHIQSRINSLTLAELAKMRAKGASDADIAEGAFIDMIAETVRGQALAELTLADQKEVYLLFCKTAEPEELRNLAKVLRENSKADSAYELERLADIREREGA